MTRNNRESAWKNIRLIELLYVLAFAVLVLVGLRLKFTEPVFWAFCAVAYGASLWIWWRQYQVLDEFGRQIFLKCWMVNGIVTSSGASLVVLWSVLHQTQSVARGVVELPLVPMWWVYACLLGGLLAMGLTNLYLRRSPRA